MAKEFAKRNAVVVLWDNNERANLETLNELKSSGHPKVYAYRVDVTDEKAVRSTASRVKDEIGDVGVVVMAAAPTFKPRSIMETNYSDDIEKHFKIGYLSQLWLIQEFLMPMIARNKGHFVQISSASAFIDLPLISSYASFKLAQNKLLETMREELAVNGISGIKTTISYLSVLKGGLADGFYDSYSFNENFQITGEYAAEKTVKAVAYDSEYVFIPFIIRFYSFLKYFVSPRFMGDVVLLKSKTNPNYLKLRRFMGDSKQD